MNGKRHEVDVKAVVKFTIGEVMTTGEMNLKERWLRER